MRRLSGAIAAALTIAASILQPAWSTAAPGSTPIRVLVLHWYDRSFSSDEVLDRALQTSLQSAAPEGIEYYAEYLESNKFPEARQPELLAQYLKQKYAGRKIDVVIASVNVTLDFLLKNRAELFPETPIVFATDRPVNARAMQEAGATGFMLVNTYAKTVDLALKLHPATEQVFVVSGTPNHDKSLESAVRADLDRLEHRIPIRYLTDLPLDDLLSGVRNLPPQSLVLYIWQQEKDRHGRLIESTDIVARIASEAKVPIYGRSYVNVGLGIVGGYVWTYDAYIAKLTELTLRVARGAHVQDIPIGTLTDTPMFDWRQLQRWGIHEELLPAGSVVQFRQLTMWQQYKWRIVGAIVVLGLQAFLVGALLIARHISRKAKEELLKHKDQLEKSVLERTAELVVARDQAMAASRAKSIFLASMSHELRTPLNAILGYAGMVMRDENLLDKHRKDLNIVGRSGEHLLTLIDGVLDMAKIESGGVTVDKASIDLHALVEESVSMLRERSQIKNLELRVEISSGVPRFIRTDPPKLRQVLMNLVGNAVKYTDAGGVVVRVDAGAHADQGQAILLLDVEDTGIGIAEEDQVRVFEPFVQAAGVRNRKGVGLGLAISRSFVQAMGGTILLQSAPGRGSRFRVDLPVEIVGSADLGPESSGEHVIGLVEGQEDFRILIVEDQRENWILLQRLLEGVGFQTRVAEDGRHAVDLFRSWRPHFIWMDVILPHLNGFEAAKQIRELQGGRDVKIAVVTASAFGSRREEVLAAGFDDFLRKPYKPHAILDCMARHLKVRYVYGTPRPAEEVPGTVRVENLDALPEAMREELKSAVVALDRELIDHVIATIGERDEKLGRALKLLAGSFAYTSIFEALESCKQPA